MRYYEYYPADPNQMRTMAAQARTSGKTVQDVSDLVARRHERALAETDGKLTTALAKPDFVGPASIKVSRAAIWAGLQIERFCDAVERYNQESVKPMSISRLNARVAEIIQAGGVERADCEPPTGGLPAGEPDMFTPPDTRTPEQIEQARLDREYELLKADLDSAATRVAQALREGPSDGEIIAAWQNGNLPAYARKAWPELDLDTYEIEGVDPDLLDIDPSDVADLVSDPSNPLSDAELEWLWLNHPEQMQEFADDWKLDEHMLPAGAAPEGRDPDDASHGWIQGPDGRWYPVQVPYQPAGNEHALHGDGWTTMDNRLTGIEDGEDMVVALPLGVPSVTGPRAVQDDQQDYWTTDDNGNLVYAGDAEAPLQPTKPQPDGPTGENGAGRDSVERVGSLLNLAVNVGEHILYYQQLAANNDYAANIVFQETPDGQRRAVLDLGQAMVDEEGNDSTKRHYGVITEDGKFDIELPGE